MNKSNNKFIEKSFKLIKGENIEARETEVDKSMLPTNEQKKRMLANILEEVKEYEVENYQEKNIKEKSFADRMKSFIIERPYRFAFTVSAIQGLVLTAIFGSNYTNLILKLFA